MRGEGGEHAWQRVCAWPGGVCMAGEGVCIAGETTTAAGGTHPTGMHSCNCQFLGPVYTER